MYTAFHEIYTIMAPQSRYESQEFFSSSEDRGVIKQQQYTNFDLLSWVEMYFLMLTFIYVCCL